MDKYIVFEDFLKKIEADYSKDEDLKLHNTFKIGGIAKFFVSPSTEEDLKEILLKCRELDIKHYLLGKGSNVLFSDDLFDGVIISTAKNFDKISLISENMIECQAGVTLASLCNFALENSFTGFECFYGIPGTVGGAIITNAGAYGSEVSDVVVEVKHLDENLDFGSYIGDEIQFSYRHSAYETNNFTICSVVFVCEKGNKDEIKAKMDDLIQRRKDKQPLEYPSAGSTFKRPVGGYAAALIDQAQLKGKQIGGAQVSEKHAGFLINKDNSTFDDMIKLIDFVKQTVKQTSDIDLECEVRIIK